MKANKPSATALLIASSALFVYGDSQMSHFIPKRSAAWSRRFVTHLFRSATLLRNNNLPARYLRGLIRAVERFTLPGIQLHYALRKRRLEEVARAALNRGVGQIVVIGAGFDSLALRLHREFPAARFVEVDHQATQTIKTQIIRAYLKNKRNLQFSACDLAQQSFAETLLQCSGYEPSETTLFIVEGVLMYLKLNNVEALLRFIREHSGTDSQIAFTFMESVEDGRIAFRGSSRFVDAWLKLRGETFKWGMERERMHRFLRQQGFTVREMNSSRSLRIMYLDPLSLSCLPLADGECLCVADSNKEN